MRVNFKGLCLAFLWVAVVADVRAAGPVRLNFEPLDSDYSVALDRIILVSASPNLLHIYNPATNGDTTIPLPDAPVSLSLGPDGLHAAVSHSSSISYVDLQAGAVSKTFPIAQGPFGVVLGPNYIYATDVFGNSGNTDVSINLATGQSTTISQDLAGGGNGFRYNTLTNQMYGSYFTLNSTTGPITGSIHDAYCGRPWFSPDKTKVYDTCGVVRQASTNAAVDGTYVTSLNGVSNVQGLASSASLNEVAVVPLNTGNSTALVDNQVLFYEPTHLNPRGRFALPGIVVNGTSYVAHGRSVFFNNASSVLYVLMQADSSAGLTTNDYSIYAIPIGNPPTCSVTLSAGSAASSDAGGLYTVSIAADSGCIYQATANVDWIQFSSNSYGAGNNILTYQVRRNLTGSSRSGTISVGSATIAVTQAAASGTAELNPFSFHVIGADYSKAVDKLILVAGLPNELHIYDGSTQSDQIVTLPAIPTSVSVSPDGTHAAVGHNGWVSYVNLQTAAVENVIPVPLSVSALSLAGNSYVYLLTNNTAGYLFSVNLTTLAVTTGANIWSGTWPVLTPSGKYLYTDQSKFDISGGTAALVDTYYSGLCSQFWISTDGTRLYGGCGNVVRASDAPAVDLTPNGSFAGVSSVNWAADSASTIHEVAVLTGTAGYNNVSTLQLYDDSTLSLLSQETTPNFSAGGSRYTGYGRYAFWNSNSSKLYVVEQADPSSNLLADYGVSAVNTAASSSNCTFTVSGGSNSISAVGGVATFTVTASAPTCNWSTYLPATSWLTLTSGSSGTGNGTVTVAVAGYGTQGNPGFVFPRSATLTIAGQTETVNQDAPCTYVISASNSSFFVGGGSGTLSIATGNGCPWVATSSANWLTFSSPATGTGNGNLSYSVAANTSGAFENGTITVGLTATAYPPVQTNISVSVVPPPIGPLRFVPVTPCRVADTRNPNGSFGGPILTANTTRDFSISASGCGVPTSAQAYSLNFTAVPPGGIGYLTVWPSGQSRPNASLLNSDGRVKAVASIVPAGANGAVSLYSSDPTHVVIDVNGYFVPATQSNALAFYPLTPCRIMDTRGAVGALGGPSLATGETRAIPVTSSSCNVPSTAQAYSLNFTVVPAGGLGYLSTWPAGQAQPFVSTLNSGHSPTANAAIVPAGSNGSINVFASDATDVVLDIDGYFAPAAAGGLSLYAATPCRPVDTRSSSQYPLGLLGSARFVISGGACGVPSTAQAYVLNVTVVPLAQLGFLSIWADGQPQPLVSTLNDWDAVVTSNMAIAPTSNGLVDVYNSSFSQVILDLSGYFAP